MKTYSIPIEEFLHLILISRDADKEEVVDAQNAAISYFIAANGFRHRKLNITDPRLMKELNILVEYYESLLNEQPSTPEVA